MLNLALLKPEKILENMKKTFKNPIFIIAIVCFVALAVVIYKIKNEDLRLPAAIQKVEMFDYSTLSGDGLRSAMTKQIIRDSTIAHKNNLFQFNFGNFIVEKSNGNPIYLCDYFDQYTITFEAEGMAVNGQRPKLIITSPCILASDLKTTQSVNIPVDLIKNMKAGDIDWTYDQQPSVTFSFRSIDGSWPQHWVLANISMGSKLSSSHDLSLDRLQIYKYSGTPPQMNW